MLVTQESQEGRDKKWNIKSIKVGQQVLSHVLAPSEPRVDIEHSMRQTRSEKLKKLFQIFSRQGANEILVACLARWKEHLRMLMVLERECLDLSEAIEDLSETRIVGEPDGGQDEPAESRT